MYTLRFITCTASVYLTNPPACPPSKANIILPGCPSYPTPSPLPNQQSYTRKPLGPRRQRRASFGPGQLANAHSTNPRSSRQSGLPRFFHPALFVTFRGEPCPELIGLPCRQSPCTAQPCKCCFPYVSSLKHQWSLISQSPATQATSTNHWNQNVSWLGKFNKFTF